MLGGDEFVADILSLVDRLRHGIATRGRTWRAVVGIARGGVFPAQRVAEALGLDYREIRISYYRGMERGPEPAILQALEDEEDGEGLLIVDDVVDSGGTALCVQRLFPGCDLAAIYTKPAGLEAVVSERGAEPYYGRHMDERWIVFPWDQPDWENRSRELIAAFRDRITGVADPGQ